MKKRKVARREVAPPWVKVGRDGGLRVSLKDFVRSERGKIELQRTEELRRNLQGRKAS
jgi:hypothetical protein